MADRPPAAYKRWEHLRQIDSQQLDRGLATPQALQDLHI